MTSLLVILEQPNMSLADFILNGNICTHPIHMREGERERDLVVRICQEITRVTWCHEENCVAHC